MLTDDHYGEKVSVEEVEEDWLVPSFYTDDSGDHVNEGDGLEEDDTQDMSRRRLLIDQLFC